MANQSTIKANDKLNDDDLIDDVKTNFKWTTKLETSLLFNMIRLKPSGKLILKIITGILSNFLISKHSIHNNKL